MLDTLESRSELPESYEMWCWRRMEDISCTDRINNKYYKESRRKVASYIRQNLGKLMGFVTSNLRNCLIKRVVEEKIEGTERRGRRLKQLLDDLQKTITWWRLQEEAPTRPQWITRFENDSRCAITRTT
jgi:hypothetical protein